MSSCWLHDRITGKGVATIIVVASYLAIVPIEHVRGFGKGIRLHVCAMAYDMTVVAGTGKGNADHPGSPIVHLRRASLPKTPSSALRIASGTDCMYLDFVRR